MEKRRRHFVSRILTQRKQQRGVSMGPGAGQPGLCLDRGFHPARRSGAQEAASFQARVAAPVGKHPAKKCTVEEYQQNAVTFSPAAAAFG